MRISAGVSRRARARSASGRCSSASARCASRRTATSYVDVCPLCQEIALEHGWVQGRQPDAPTVSDRARRRRLGLARCAASSRREARRPSRSSPSRSCAGSPSPSRRWSRRPTSSTRAPYRRTVGGIAQEPRRAAASSIVPLSGRQPRGRRHGRVGDLLVPVPRHARLGASRCGSPSAATTRPSSRRRSATGTRSSTPDGRVVPDIPPV